MPVVPATPSFDPSTLVYGLFILIAALIVVSILYRRSRSRRRERVTAEFAAERGWQYQHQVPREFLHTLPSAYPFSGGDNQGAYDLITGGELMSFGFYFWTRTTSADDSSSRVDFHVVALPLPAPLPQVQISTKRGALRQGGALRFESAAFNSAWLVYSEHPQAAYDLLHPRMLEWLQARSGNYLVQDERIYYWRQGPQEPAAVEEIAVDLRAFVDLIPAHVWQKAQGEYPRPQRYSPVADLGRFVQVARQHYRDRGESQPPASPPASGRH